MTEDVREFDCADCGAHVVQIIPAAANDQDVCAECGWLRSVEDPQDRENLRVFLNRTRMPDG